jgi:DNA (cytosine-5)-methyltransferase 1
LRFLNFAAEGSLQNGNAAPARAPTTAAACEFVEASKFGLASSGSNRPRSYLPAVSSPPRPAVVSLFSGAGGLDIGLERAGWQTVAATDFDSDCVATLTASRDAGLVIDGDGNRTYLADASLICADAVDLAGKDLTPTGAPRGWRPDLVAGGPPCQPWSSAGLQQGFNDPRGRLVEQFIRLVDQLRPRFVLFENVRGLVTAVGANGKPGEALRLIQHSLEEIGYVSTAALLNAADFGAPQRRVRLFLIGSAQYDLPVFPEATHRPGRDLNLLDERREWVSLGDFLSDRPPLNPTDVVRPSGKRAAELARLEPGSGLRTSGRVESNRPGGHWGYRQDCFVADLSLPSRTIRAATTPDWIKEDDGTLRRLTWRECAGLQGFPDEWRFVGTAASRFRQIGNGVQTTVAQTVGQAILGALAAGPAEARPVSPPWPADFHRRVRYTVSEHRVNGKHRVRVQAAV